MNSRQKTAAVLTTALLLTVGLVAAVQASGGDIAACIEKNGNLVVADTDGECKDKAETITLASGGTAGTSVSFYVVEASYAAPENIPEPPSPYPRHPGLVETLTLPAGQVLAACSNGDVAVDGSHTFMSHARAKDTGATNSTIGSNTGLVALPFTGTDAPIGYGFLNDVDLSHRWYSLVVPVIGNDIEETVSLTVRVTCADITP